jgi:hypothetical protein
VAGYTITPQTAFGTVSVSVTTDSSPAGFTANQTFTTGAGKTIVTQTGGTNFFTNTDTDLGLMNLIDAEGTIVSSTDPAVTTAGSVNFTGFGKVPSLNLQYAQFGLWSISPCNINTDCTPAYIVAVGGSQPGVTPTSAMPTIGNATYTGLAVGYVQQPVANNANNVGVFKGNIGLTANFDSNAITGQIAGLQTFNVEDSSMIGAMNDIGLSGTISGANYTGTASVIGRTGAGFDITGATGGLTGTFYGPNATETAGAFYLTGGANNTSLTGAFGAKAGSEMFIHFREVAALGSSGGSLTATLTSGLSGVRSIVTTVDNATPAGFTATVPFVTKTGSPSAIVVASAGGSNSVASVSIAGRTGVDELDLTINNSTDPAITTAGGGEIHDFTGAQGLSYASFGTWTLQACSNSSDCDSTYAGTFGGAQGGSYQTQTLPTGTATYNGGATGFVLQPVGTNPLNAARFSGAATLTANFTTGAVTGGVSGITAYHAETGAAVGSVNNIGMTATITGTTFNGTTSVTGGAGTAFDIAGATGTVNGAFFGPAAQEAAGVFNVTGGANNTTLLGSFGTAK